METSNPTKISNHTISVIDYMFIEQLKHDFKTDPDLRQRIDQINQFCQRLECQYEQPSTTYEKLSKVLKIVDNAILDIRDPKDAADERMVAHVKHQIENITTRTNHQQYDASVGNLYHHIAKKDLSFLDTLIEFDIKLRYHRSHVAEELRN